MAQKANGCRLLFARPQLFLAMPTLLRGNPGTLLYHVRAGIALVAQGQALGALWTHKKIAMYTARGGANPRWWCVGHVYDGGRASMRRLCVRVLCL